MAFEAEIHLPLDREPISVAEISPTSLAEFLKGQNKAFSFEKPNYLQIFTTLRALPQEQQQELLVKFLTKGIKGIPNPEKMGRFLSRVNNIRLFEPRKAPEQTVLQNLTDQYFSRLNRPSLDIKVIESDWDAAWAAKGPAKLDVAWDVEVEGPAELEAAWNVVRTVIRAAILARERSATRARAGDAEFEAQAAAKEAAKWIIVQDLMPQEGHTKGNPFNFEALLGIYELGCWPLGIAKNPEGKEEFVIFVPPIQKST